MEIKTTGKFIKYLLILQILILIGIGICEIVQLSEINKSQQIIINHPNDWDYLVGYTNDFMIVMAKVYNWVIMFISIGILGRSLSSFNKRWKNIQDYSDKSQNILLLVLWCISTIPSIIILSSSNGMKSCSKSSYTYPVTPRLLRQCNAYLASLLLAYILILSIIIQLLFHLVVVKHQKRINNIKQPTITEGPKLKRVRRSKRVAKKRTSLKSAFSNGTRLSVVTEDDEDKRNSNKSNRSMRSVRNNKILGANHSKFNNEKQVYSNV